jgi:hypothetical protein
MWQRHWAIAPHRFRLIPFRSPLLRESLLLSFPRGTEMFQFPRFPLPALCVQTGVTPHHGCWVSPFGYPRIKAWSAAPRGFSQPPTSFIGVRCQGIHRWLFIAWKNKDARTRYAVLKERGRQLERRRPGRRRTDAARPGGRGGSAVQYSRDRSLKTEERTVCPSREPPPGGKNLLPTTLAEADRASLQLGSRPHGVWKH